MKTKTFIKSMSLIAITLIAVRCNKSKDDASTPTTSAGVTSSGYHFGANGACYSSQNQIVNNSYCMGQPNQQYQQYPQYPNQPYQNYGSSQQCFGNYNYYSQQNGFQQVYCNGANCAGYPMYSQSGTQVYCQ